MMQQHAARDNARVLARLQQLITLGGLLASALWLWLGWRSGFIVRGMVGAAAVLGAHAAVLAVEFMFLRLAHGDDPTPRASRRQLFGAWCGEACAAPRVFCWRQPFRVQRWPDRLPHTAPGRRGVLLVHGFVCNRGLWNPWLQRLTASGTPFVAVNLEPVFGSIDETTGCIERAVRHLEASTGLAPVAVAHSMGGLALRRWWAAAGNDTRIHHAITIGTPHHGAWLARFATTCAGRQMRRHSRWLRSLAQQEPPGRARRFTCFYSHCDNIVFPAASATLGGADNRHLPGVAHLRMADHPAPWQALQRLLQQQAVTP